MSSGPGNFKGPYEAMDRDLIDLLGQWYRPLASYSCNTFWGPNCSRICNVRGSVTVLIERTTGSLLKGLWGRCYVQNRCLNFCSVCDSRDGTQNPSAWLGIIPGENDQRLQDPAEKLNQTSFPWPDTDQIWGRGTASPSSRHLWQSLLRLSMGLIIRDLLLTETVLYYPL